MIRIKRDLHDNLLKAAIKQLGHLGLTGLGRLLKFSFGLPILILFYLLKFTFYGIGWAFKLIRHQVLGDIHSKYPQIFPSKSTSSQTETLHDKAALWLGILIIILVGCGSYLFAKGCFNRTSKGVVVIQEQVPVVAMGTSRRYQQRPIQQSMYGPYYGLLGDL